MTLPLSGPISIAQIANEVGVPTNTSLRNLSNTAGFGTPDSFSEFYGYPPTPTPSVTPSITPTPSVTPTPSPSTTPASSPAASPTPTPSPSTTPASSPAASPTPTPSPLPSLPSYFSSTTSTFGGVCSESLTQTYYHNGLGATPTFGDTCYSDSAGTTILPSGYYLLTGDEFINVNASGVVQDRQSCSAGPGGL